MKTIAISNEPITSEKRNVEVSLGGLNASVQVILVNKEDDSEIMRAVPVSINLGIHAGFQDDDSEEIKNAKLVCLDTIEDAIGELCKVIYK